MADARTILAGGNLINDAYRQRIAAAAAKRERKKSAVREASEAFTGLGDAFKKYGDWQQLKAEEEEQRGIQNDLALGLSTGGAEGALVALQARKPSTRAGAELLADRIDTLTERVRDQKESELDRANEFHWKDVEAKRRAAADGIARFKAETDRMEFEAELEADRREREQTEKAQREAAERSKAFRDRLELGDATVVDAWVAAMEPDGTVNATLFSRAYDAVQGMNPDAEPNTRALAKQLGVEKFFVDGMSVSEVLRVAALQSKGSEPGESRKWDGAASAWAAIKRDEYRAATSVLESPWAKPEQKQAAQAQADALMREYQEFLGEYLDVEMPGEAGSDNGGGEIDDVEAEMRRRGLLK